MIPSFSSFRFDLPSFFLGVLIFCLVSLIIWGVKRTAVFRGGKNRSSWIKSIPRQTGQMEKIYLRELYLSTQRLHLAGEIFPFDEIKIKPLLLAPPVRSQPDETQASLSMIPSILPYLPDWPELPGLVNAPRLSLSQALSGGMDLLIVAPPGHGKTSLFIDLISEMAGRPDSSKGSTARIPFYLTARDFGPIGKGIAEEKIFQGITKSVPVLKDSSLKAYFFNLLSSGRVLILLDGLDELSPSEIDVRLPIIESFKKAHPNAQIVLTSNQDLYLTQAPLGFTPLYLASWTRQDLSRFLQNWIKKWSERILTKEDTEFKVIDFMVRENALETLQQTRSPFEITLQILLFCSGNPSFEDPSQLIKSYLLTRKIDDEAIAMVSRMAANFLQKEVSQLSINKIQEMDLAFTEIKDDAGESQSDSQNTQRISMEEMLQSLLDAQIMVQSSSGEVYFSRTSWLSFFAAQALVSTEIPASEFNNFTKWQAGRDAIHFLAMISDITAQVDQFLRKDEQPLFPRILLCSRWIPWSLGTSAWRITLFKKLALYITKDFLPFSVRVRFLSALALSGDASIPGLLNHFLSSPDEVLKQLSILGMSLTGQPQNISVLQKYLSAENPRTRFSSCLALGSYLPQKKGIENIARVLLRGDETNRRLAAEILSSDPEDGYSILQEAVTLEDILTRRAVVFGLARVQQPWAIDLLKKMQVEDSQWVVRNAAAQALEIIEKGIPDIPHPLADPHNAPWLIEFASKQGYGISPEKDITEILYLAMNHGNNEEKSAAMDYLHFHPSEEYVGLLYQLIYSADPHLCDKAYLELWYLDSSNYPLPPVQKFGLGYPNL